MRFLPPRSKLRYHAFTDASAGRNDAFSVCIGHTEGTRQEPSWVCDVVRGVSPPFDPRSVAIEYARLARSYGCHKITGDAFSGEWVAGAFADAGIEYQTSPLNRSALYLEALPHFNRGAVSLPNHERLLRELRNLERRVNRSGKDSVDPPRAGSDDHANAVCGCLYLAMHDLRAPRVWVGTGLGNVEYSRANNPWMDAELPRIRIERISEEEDLRRRGQL